MVQTFSYRTNTQDQEYHHTVHSIDITSSVEKWLRQIEDLQARVYSFDQSQVENIRQQFLNGQLKMELDNEPYFLTYKVGDIIQVVNIDQVEKGQPDLVAKVHYLTSEEGGRKGYAASGYRPHIKFNGKKELTSGEQLFVDKEKVFPGETATAEIRILSPHFLENYLFVGQHFQIGEGTKVIGHGEVLEIINPKLRQACL